MSLYGIDESVYQGTLEGQDFAIIRATLGDSYVDPTCDTKYQKNKADGKLLGVYHYAYPASNDPVTEADWFVNNVQGYLGEALLVLDFETNTNVGWAKAFLDHVYARTQVRPMIYMSASTSNAVDWSSVSGQYALYEAGYPAKENVASPPVPEASGADMPYASGSWKFATIWQYSSSAGTLDRDIAYMTADSWHKFALGDRNAPTAAPVAPVPAPTPIPPTVPSAPPVPEPSSVPEPTPPVQPDPVPVPPSTAEPTTDTGTDTIPIDEGTTGSSPISTPVPPLVNPPTEVVVSPPTENKSVLQKFIEWLKSLFKEKK